MAVTQIAHLTEETTAPHAAAAGLSYPPNESVCYYEHQLRTALDFAAPSSTCFFLTGGLNLQVAHHLFPAVNHCHLRALVPIISRVAEKHGLRYLSSPSMSDSLARHWGLIKAVRRDHLTAARKSAASTASLIPPGRGAKAHWIGRSSRRRRVKGSGRQDRICLQ